MIEQTRTNTKKHEYRTALNQQHIALFYIQLVLIQRQAGIE
jgi:hypothetical protein